MSPVGDGGSEKTKERHLKKTRTFQNRVGTKKLRATKELPTERLREHVQAASTSNPCSTNYYTSCDHEEVT